MIKYKQIINIIDFVLNYSKKLAIKNLSKLIRR